MIEQIAYLDYNATAPIRAEAAAAVLAALQIGGNPSSVHARGRLARNLVEDARAEVAALVGAGAAQVIFTSGGTEANNLALSAVPARRLIVSAVEHDSVLSAAAEAEGELEVVPVDHQGVIDLVALEESLTAEPGPALVSVMLANNETGVIQPIASVVALAHEQGALVHCDAVQAAGKLPLDFASFGVDMLSVSAHKLGGPQGVGALVVRDGLAFHPRQHGGGQEFGRRAGTENVSGIAGFGAAARVAKADLGRAAAIATLRDGIERRIKAAAPVAPIWGEGIAKRLPNTSCIGMPGVPSETQVMALDLAGVAISAGAACSSGKVKPSHVLRAMGASAEAAGCSIRVSLGYGTTASDVDRFIEAWTKLYVRVSHRAARDPAA